MAGEFLSPSGNLENILVSDYNMIDQYIGGSLWIWGDNSAGQLGTNNTTNRLSPVQTVSAGTNWEEVALGYEFAATIKTDGTLWVWGKNDYGQLGDNTIVFKSSPIQTVAGGTNWKQVSCGCWTPTHTAAIKTDGTLWLWGSGQAGRLGDNATTSRSSPIQTTSLGTNWKQVSCGDEHTAAIKTDNTLWIWGYNLYGQLGDNTTTGRSSPIQTTSAGTNWKQVSCGRYHTTAIKTDGTLWLWGENVFGQLGDNTITKKSSPVQTVSGGTNWKQVSCGYNHTTAIKTDGTLWLWGSNGTGQLGDNTTASKSSPVQTVSGGTNWKQSAGGVDHTGAIKTDGTLWLWGPNSFDGRIGTNQIFNSFSSPVQTASGGTNWKQVSCGYTNSSAIYFYDVNNLYPSA